jgi:hypothetical protein
MPVAVQAAGEPKSINCKREHPFKRIIASRAKTAREGWCSLPRRLWTSDRFIGPVWQWRPGGQGFP